MAKITDRKRNNIVAKWKTGVYTQRELAKTYNVDVATINKIVKEIPKENADLVEAGVVFENAKKSTKSQQEISEINKAIEYRLKKEFSEDNKRVKVYDLSYKLIDVVEDLLKNKKVKEKINVGIGVQEFQERDLNTSDVKNISDTISQIGKTLSVVDNKETVINNANVQENKNLEIVFK